MKNQANSQQCPIHGCSYFKADKCTRQQCGLSLTLKGPARLKRRMMADLSAFLTADVLYHAFTGEQDIYKLEKIKCMSINDPLMIKAAENWSTRLAELDAARTGEARAAQTALQQYIINFNQ
jgi:hypothetical protein